MGHEYSFLKFLNKPMQTESHFGSVSLEYSGHQLMCIEDCLQLS